MPARLGILLSGSGTTYANLVERIRDGSLPAEIAVVVSSRADAYGLERAKGYGHPMVVARRPDEVTAALRTYDAAWVAMCGYMRFWDPPTPWKGRTVNVHPALLPSFGGQGMYGHHVHEAVLKHGCRVSGCTVHLVDGAYDAGPILDQAAVRIDDGETPDSLAAKVQAAERALYPQVLARLIRAASAHGVGP